jgi:hypothetical protein
MRGIDALASAQLSLTSKISNCKIVVNMMKRKRRPESALCKTSVTKEITATPEVRRFASWPTESTVS